ncbi:hypothetical protein AwDysgo_11540 [Bacteroidales bacterium]|nr:hypothetical protein AwDysgo_11540 [Bacteroidales bacterium]
MQLTAKLTLVLPLQSGQGKNGEWRKQDIIVETDGQYPKKICISVWGDRINESQLQVGNMLTIDFDIESREYSSRWYTDIKAWKVELAGSSSGSFSPPSGGEQYASTPPPPLVSNPADDLPF